MSQPGLFGQGPAPELAGSQPAAFAALPGNPRYRFQASENHNPWR